jgi:hypothetical protein
MGGYERMVEDSNFTWPKHPRMGRGLALPRRNSKTNPALNSCREMPSAFTVFRM